MLLLVTLALVVASAVLLILGFVQDALGFIYLSMLCAGVAALALFIFARLTRRRSAALGVGPAVAGDAGPYATDNVVAAPATTGLGGHAAPRAGNEADTAVLVAAAPAPTSTHEAGPQHDDPWAAGASSTDWGDEVVFPIEDYDDLRVAEILPLLSQLETDELQEVRDRELAGKARATILDRIDDRLNRSRLPAATSREDTAETDVISAVEPGSEAGAAVEGPGAEVWAAPAPEAPKKRGGRKKAAVPVIAAEPAPASEPAGSDVASGSDAVAGSDVAAAADTPAPVRVKRAYTRRTPVEKAAATKTIATKTAATKVPAKKAAAKKSAAAGAVPAKKAAGATKAAAKKAAGPTDKAPGATKRATNKATDS